MDGLIDSHQWASKIETQRFLFGKPELKIRKDARTINNKTSLRVMSLPLKVSSFLRWIAR